MSTCIWRDKHDPDQFFLGVANTHTRLSGARYTAWACVYIDGLSELFGDVAFQDIKQIEPGAKPVEINLELSLKESP